MDDLHIVVREFFKNRLQNKPQVNSSGQLGGWFEAARANIFQSSTGMDISRQSALEYVHLRGEVYEVSLKTVSAIIAVYPDNSILWLDEHVDDADYRIFFARENLAVWTSDRVDMLVRLITQTKFNYLGMPRPVSVLADFPTISEETTVISDHLRRKEAKLIEAISAIYPPICLARPFGETILDFYIWTEIFGKLIHLNCEFNPHEIFTYTATLVSEGIGNYIVPR